MFKSKLIILLSIFITTSSQVMATEVVYKYRSSGAGGYTELYIFNNCGFANFEDAIVHIGNLKNVTLDSIALNLNMTCKQGSGNCITVKSHSRGNIIEELGKTNKLITQIYGNSNPGEFISIANRLCGK